MAVIALEKPEWLNIVGQYLEKIATIFGERIIKILVAPHPDDLVYNANIIIVVKKLEDKDFDKALETARKLEKTMNLDITILPYVVEKDSIVELEAEGKWYENEQNT